MPLLAPVISTTLPDIGDDEFVTECPALVGSGSLCPVAGLCDPAAARRYRDPAGFIDDPANPDRSVWPAMQDRISSQSRKDSGSVPMPVPDPYQEMASIIARFASRDGEYPTAIGSLFFNRR